VWIDATYHEEAADDILAHRVAERRYFSSESMRLLTQPPVLPGQEELLAAVSQHGVGEPCTAPPHPPNSTT
jgi:hypothetical protein